MYQLRLESEPKNAFSGPTFHQTFHEKYVCLQLVVKPTRESFILVIHSPIWNLKFTLAKSTIPKKLINVSSTFAVPSFACIYHVENQHEPLLRCYSCPPLAGGNRWWVYNCDCGSYTRVVDLFVTFQPLPSAEFCRFLPSHFDGARTLSFLLSLVVVAIAFCSSVEHWSSGLPVQCDRHWSAVPVPVDTNVHLLRASAISSTIF